MEMSLQAITFIRNLDYPNMTLLEVFEVVKKNNIRNSNGEEYLISQVSDMLKQIVKGSGGVIPRKIDKCGIDRDSNPCGDASDY